MAILEDKIRAFLDVGDGYGSGYGSGNGDGYGSGYGSGNGYGYGDGSGSGYGSGNGYGYGDGYGDGYGCGDGYGNGCGDGYGNGCGDGYGNGYGDGYGYGYGNGCGDGYGCGDGISEIDGKKVYSIDNVPTIIESLKGNVAKGYTLRSNVELVPCFVVKVGNFFAHGETLHEAMQSAQEKYDENRPLSERIDDTIRKYPTLDTKVSHSELYSLHHTLTGSCKFGRDEFAKSHNLDPDNGEMTMREFIDLTKGAYGGDVILKLERAYEAL